MFKLVCLIIICVLIYAVSNFLQNKSDSSATVKNGFEKVMMPLEAVPDKVFVWVPENCPREESQRSRELVAQLKSMDIPVSSGSTVSIPNIGPNKENWSDEAETTSALLSKGELPIVFYNGMGMANPSVEYVVSLYQSER